MSWMRREMWKKEEDYWISENSRLRNALIIAAEDLRDAGKMREALKAAEALGMNMPIGGDYDLLPKGANGPPGPMCDPLKADENWTDCMPLVRGGCDEN